MKSIDLTNYLKKMEQFEDGDENFMAHCQNAQILFNVELQT